MTPGATARPDASPAPAAYASACRVLLATAGVRPRSAASDAPATGHEPTPASPVPTPSGHRPVPSRCRAVAHAADSRTRRPTRPTRGPRVGSNVAVTHPTSRRPAGASVSRPTRPAPLLPDASPRASRPLREHSSWEQSRHTSFAGGVVTGRRRQLVVEVRLAWSRRFLKSLPSRRDHRLRTDRRRQHHANRVRRRLRRQQVDLLPTIGPREDDTLALGVDAERLAAGLTGQVERSLRHPLPRQLQ